jgi:ferritin-like metal-binding protein YciE
MADVKDPRQLFAFKLGVALQMERTVMSILRENEQKATDPELKEMLSHHRDETEQQIANLEQVFSALGESAQGHKSPAIDGLKQEGETLLGKVEDGLIDSVILGGAAAIEHHEISVYEGLITKAEAMGEDDVVALLQENLEQEQHTLQEVQRKTQQVAQQKARASG